MTHTEFWTRMGDALGSGYAQAWASQQVITALGGRTVSEALDAGIPPKEVWREVWRVLDLPPSQR
ncbi:MAG: DUF3046 domain-containing protein [Pseudonocardia sp.]